MTIKQPNSKKNNLTVRVKTARGRKKSSTRWLQRQLNDPYVNSAKEDGFLSRAAYKLIEIEEKFKILKNSHSILDLGSSPGSFTQVARIYSPNSQIIAVDLNEMHKIGNVDFIQGDFYDENIQKKIVELNSFQKFNLIMSDMAPNFSGHKQTDHLRTIALAEEVFEFSKKFIESNGSMVIKLFQGAEIHDFLKILKNCFKIVKNYKPNSSRQESAELYTVCTNYKG